MKRSPIEELVIVGLIVSLLSAIWYYKNRIESIQPQVIEHNTTIEVPITTPGQLVAITIDDLYNDLATYDHLSNAHRTAIITTIVEVSHKYDINPIIVYSLIHVESTFRWWLIHGTDKDKDRACGLGGIRYGIWGDQLKSEGIIETKSDLYLIEPNIRAIGYVYNHNRQLELKSGSSHSDMSALIRYFGGNYKEYFKRIDDKIISIFHSKLYR